MDFIFDNLIFVILIAVTVVSQIGRLLIRRAEKRKREERGERAEDRRAAAVRGVYGEYEGGEEDEGEDGAFSAWNLSVEDEGAGAALAVPVSPFPATAPRPVAVPFSAPFSAPFPAPYPVLAAGPALGAEKHGPEGFSPPAPEPGALVGGNGRPGGRVKRRAGFPGKLDYLPPLKRAVVLAEILGPPKGFC
jgi:hypothetical protein